MEFLLPALRVHDRSPADGLIEFECPECGRLVLRGVGAADAGTLLRTGASAGRGSAPFELLEEHAGGPITWDDVLDFHQLIARFRRDPGPPTDAAWADEPAQETDAA